MPALLSEVPGLCTWNQPSELSFVRYQSAGCAAAAFACGRTLPGLQDLACVAFVGIAQESWAWEGLLLSPLLPTERAFGAMVCSLPPTFPSLPSSSADGEGCFRWT